MERAFQMLTQVSGRAGRRQKQGKVLIQTNNPSHPLLEKVIQSDYVGFYDSEITERQFNNYPPFTRVIELTIKNESAELAQKAAQALAKPLADKLGRDRILGPEKALIEKIRNKYLYEIWIKLEKDKLNIKAAKTFLREQIMILQEQKEFKTVEVVVDVDAM
jgi:primosomal protein N' (replication factor Y) (superfamily II helicase)